MTGPTPEFRVPPELAGARLDRALAALVGGLSRTRLKTLVQEGRVRVDGNVVDRPDTAVVAGMSLALDVPTPEAPRTAEGAEVRRLVVLHEDEDIVVVDKPAGLVTHANDKYQTGTVAHLAVAQFGPLPEVQGADRPGIVHRLDRLTSGVLVIGRTEAALLNLKRQFQERRVEKTYFALVLGTPRFHSDWIDDPIAPIPSKPNRYRVVRGPVEEGDDPGRPASTYWEVKERFDGSAWLLCKPKTGRTHQIRVHLQCADMPIAGDHLYRPRRGVGGLPADAPPLHRQALHAARLAFDHPRTGKRVSFEAPLAKDLERVLDWLRDNRPVLGD